MTAAPCFRADGSVMDLAAPHADDIDWRAVAYALARTSRFNGGHPDRPSLPVAQHCALGADALFAESGDALVAGLFLLHDAHEWRFGDFTTPAARMLAEVFARSHGGTVAFAHAEKARAAVLTAIDDAKSLLDSAIYCKAGLPVPAQWPLAVKKRIKEMDSRMAVAEARALYGSRAARTMPGGRLPAPPLKHALAPWGAEKAAREWLDRLSRFCGVEAR